MIINKKIFLVLIIFLIMGCVNATYDVDKTDDIVDHDFDADNQTDDFVIQDFDAVNQTDDTFNYEFPDFNKTIIIHVIENSKDFSLENGILTKNLNINLTVKEGNSIPVNIEPINNGLLIIGSFNNENYLSFFSVYVDNQKVYSKIINLVNQNKFDIPINNVDFSFKTHNISFEFEMINSNSQYLCDVDMIKNVLNFKFYQSFLSNFNNTLYRFNSNLTILKKSDPIISTIPIDSQINISYSDSISIKINDSYVSKLNIFIDGKLFKSYSYEKIQSPLTISTLNNTLDYIPCGTYDITFEFIINDYSSNIKPVVNNKNSILFFEFIDLNKTDYPYDYVYKFSTVLNVVDIIKKEIIINNTKGDTINITYSNSIPVLCFDIYDDIDVVSVYVDDKLIHRGNLGKFIKTYYLENNSDTYVSVGNHNIRFEFSCTKTHIKYNPYIKFIEGQIRFFFLNKDFEDNLLYNFTYVCECSLNVINKSDMDPISIVNDELNEITIVRTNPISFMVNNVKSGILKVFIDDDQVGYFEISERFFENSINTFVSSNTVFKDDLYNLCEGKHNLMFEFYFSEDYVSVPIVYMSDSVLNFEFGGSKSLNSSNTIYQFNSTLNVVAKNSTVHIVEVLNDIEWESDISLYFDDVEDDEEVHFGVIFSNESGIVYKYDDSDEVYLGLAFSTYCCVFEEFGNLIYNLYAGIYNVTVVNFKDGTNDTVLVEFLKENISFKEYEEYNPSGVIFYCSVYSNYIFNKYLTVTLDGKSIKKFMDDRYYDIEFFFTNLIPGEYNVSFFYQGDRIYNDLNYTRTVKIENQNISFYDDHEVHDDSVDIYVSGDMEEYNFDYFDIYEADFVLFVSVGDIVKKIQVNGIDDFKITFDNLIPGVYDLVVYWPGDEGFNEYRFETSFEILPNEEISLDNETENNNGTNNSSEAFFNGTNFLKSNNTNGGEVNGSSNSQNHNIKPSKDDSISKNNHEVFIEKESRFNGVGNLNSPVQSSLKYYELKKSSSKAISDDSISLFVVIACIILFFIGIFYVFGDKKDFDEY